MPPIPNFRGKSISEDFGHLSGSSRTMAVGRDASGVALTTSFGTANLRSFAVITDEVFQEVAAYA